MTLPPVRRPDPLMVIGVIAVLVFAVAASCAGVEDDDCDRLGLSAAPAATGRPAPVSKAPARPSARPVTKAPPATSTATARHRGGDVDLDPCD